MRSIVIIGRLNLLCQLSIAQNIYAVYWNGMEEVFTVLDANTGTLNDIAILPGVTSIQSNGTFDSKVNRYALITNLGITVVDALDGSIISAVSNTNNMTGLAFGPNNNIYGVYWNGMQEIFAELDLQTGNVNDISVLPFVQSIQNVSGYDGVQNRYFIVTNIGTLIINASDGSILQTISNPIGLTGLNFDCNNGLYGVYWNGMEEIFARLDLDNEVINDIGIVPGVQSIQNAATYDPVLDRYLINTNLGVTIVNPSDGSVTDAITFPMSLSALAAANDCGTLVCGSFPWDGIR